MCLLCGRIALVFLLDRARFKPHNTMPSLTLLELSISADRAEVIVEALGIGLPELD